MATHLAPRTAARCPLLAERIESGTITIEDGEYIGHAADGVDVNLGTVGYESRVEKYLQAHPRPCDW